jgi:chromatin segregation and condensation protein Rec8/ScpA/Scc1 (kleisin family)
MNPGILFMMTVEKRFEDGPQEYIENLCHLLQPSVVEKRFETRHQEYEPRRDRQESVEPARQLERSDLVRRISALIRRHSACECG